MNYIYILQAVVTECVAMFVTVVYRSGALRTIHGWNMLDGFITVPMS